MRFALFLAALLAAPTLALAQAPTPAPSAPAPDFLFNTCGQNRETIQVSPLRQLYEGGREGSLDQLADERVRVEGTVAQYLESDVRTTDFYILSDSYGVAIMVQSPNVTKPRIGEVRCVEGVVGFNRVPSGREANTYLATLPDVIQGLLRGSSGRAANGDLIVPLIREVAAAPPCPPGTSMGPGGQCIQPGNGDGTTPPWWVWALAAGAALALVGLVGVYATSRRSAQDDETTRTMLRGTPVAPLAPPPPPPPAPVATTPPPPAGMPAAIPMSDDKGTIKLFRPRDEGTVKVLPGRLRVEGGLTGIPEIRFFMPRGRTTTEISFGRTSGKPYEHVELTPRTVSSRQARLIYDGTGYTLVNLASRESNPTQLNGRDMAPDERAMLQDGDRIAMGEVEFVYSAS